jgi:signal transduction histidine kinase
MIKSYLDIETHNTETKINGVVRSFVQLCEDFSNKMNDWSLWDDTYNFMLDKNPRYIESNISYESMHLLKLDFIFFVNSSDEIILNCYFDHGQKKIINADDSFKKRILEIADILSSKNKKTETSHLFSIDSRPVMAASNLVLTSLGAGPSRGYLIYGRFINEGDIDKIDKLTALNLSYSKIKDDFLTSEVSRDPLDAGVKYSIYKILTPDALVCNILVNDANNKPLFMIKFEETRKIYRQSSIALKYFAAALLITSSFFFILTSFLINRFFADRIIKLSREVGGVTLDNNNKRRVTAEGNDEIAMLAGEINLMLDNIEASGAKMAKLIKDLDTAARAKSDFIGNIGHELRTPITCIIGYADMLSEMLSEGEPREFVNRIKLGGHILVSTVNDIIDYISIEDGELTLKTSKFKLADAFNEVIGYAGFIANEKKLEFSSRIDHYLLDLMVVGDETRLKQIVLNLTGNAIKFTSSGFIEIGALILSETPEDIRVKIYVKDSGAGISEEKQEEIFMPFVQGDNSTTRKYGGTGLGLSIANHLVKLMGGERINLESRPGAGSNFFFNIKLTKA